MSEQLSAGLVAELEPAELAERAAEREARKHPRRRGEAHYRESPRAATRGETAWRASRGAARRVRLVPCASCGHEPGEHRGWAGQDTGPDPRDRPRCSSPCACAGYSA